MLIETETEFGALQRTWNELAARAEHPSIFLRHEWFSAAWAWRKADAQLHILTATDGPDVIGIMPLVRSVGPDGLRVLRPLAVPDTQRWDVVAAAADAPRAAAMIASTLCASPDWDVMELNCLDAGGGILNWLLPSLAGRVARVRSVEIERNAYVSMPEGWSTYYRSRSRSVKKANNLAANRLTRAGAVRVACLKAPETSEAEFAEALDDAIRVSARSWKGDTNISLEKTGPQAFIRALSAGCYSQRAVSLWMLYLDDVPLAMEYQVLCDGDVYGLRSDFDASCTRLSPGTHLLHMLIERLSESDFRRYYLGRGENAYKSRWANAAEPVYRLIAYNTTLRGAFKAARDSLVQPVRSLRDRLVSG